MITCTRPDAATVLDHVLTRYVESLVSPATSSLASEHAARMVAMKSASDNATKAIGNLTLIYNKARQAAITRKSGDRRRCGGGVIKPGVGNRE